MTEAATDIALIFQLDGESFALPVDQVLEIVDPCPVTPVPNASALAPGLVNVRGTILPIFDLRLRLGLQPRAADQGVRLVVYDTAYGDRRIRVAFEADSVDRVTEFEPGASKDFPDMAAAWPPECLDGAVRDGETLIVRLNPGAVFSFPPADSDATQSRSSR